VGRRPRCLASGSHASGKAGAPVVAQAPPRRGAETRGALGVVFSPRGWGLVVTWM